MVSTITILVIHVLKLGISLARHGEDRVIKVNFFSEVFACAIALILYYYAGLFDKFL